MTLPSKSSLFAILMTVSALSAFLLPARWTNWIRAPFQSLALLQMLPMSGAQSIHEAVTTFTAPAISGAKAQELQDEVDRLRRAVGHLETRLAEQGEEVDELTRLRGQALDNLQAIVRASVVSGDSDPRRASLQIRLTTETEPYVFRGQWVVAAVAAPPSRSAVARGWLVGRVSDVHLQTGRVQLTTDPAFQVGVRVARTLGDGTWQISDEECRLKGAGEGRMVIDAAARNYFEQGYDIVLVPASAELPFAMTIGRITGVRRRGDSPQHVDLEVAPWGPATALRHVYLLSTGAER